VTYTKGERVKVKGRRGVHTIKAECANGDGWWLIAPDGGRWVPARLGQMRRVS
jgi:hypothetical protein